MPPTPLTGWRTGVATLDNPTLDGSEQTQEIDLQLGARQGIEIASVRAQMLVEYDATSTAAHRDWRAGLYRGRPGAQFDPVSGTLVAGSLTNGWNSDGDVIHEFAGARQALRDSTNDLAAYFEFGLTPLDARFDPPMAVASNLTISLIANSNLTYVLLRYYVWYRWVQFSLEELAVLLARRS